MHQFNQKIRVRDLIIGLCFIILFFALAYDLNQNKAKKQTSVISPQVEKQTPVNNIQRDSSTFPARLKIPRINVDAVIEFVGFTPIGAMGVPSNITNVGWYKFGPSPGEIGNAVIDGHFDGIKGQTGVFNNLDKLKPGDKVYVLNQHGETTTFVVRESREFNPGTADEVFLANDKGIHLNLITCDGIWNDALKSYSKRLVVFADSLNS